MFRSRACQIAMLVAAATAYGAVGGAALAAEPKPGQTQTMPSQPAADWTHEQLESFVEAALSVDRVVEKWAPQMDQAANQSEADAIRAKATAEAAQAIESEGITVAEYQQIAAAAEQQPALRDRLQQIMQTRSSQ